MFKEYTDDEILIKLNEEHCDGDVELFSRWMKIKQSGGCYNDLAGGNVYFIGDTVEEKDLNKKNEHVRIASIECRFGRLAPTVHYFTKYEFNDILNWQNGGM